MRANPGITLRGDRNECPACGLLFNSTAAFDKHRVGDIGMHNSKTPNPYGPVRRCMTVAEMQERGMAVSNGYWVTALNTNYAEAA